MKIDAINYGAFTSTTPLQNIKAEETNSSLDEYDETRIAQKAVKETPVENPIERKNGSIEDLMSLQKSTEKMAQSYGYSSIAEAQNATASASTSTEASSAVSAPSSVSSGGISA